MTDDVVAVVGSGTMGAGIAALAMKAGLRTVLVDVDGEALQQGARRIDDLFARDVKKERLSQSDADEALRRLQLAQEIGEDIADATLIVEAVPEILDLKANVLSLAADAAPGATIASNTSSIPIAEIGQASAVTGRLIGLHFFNPPSAMKLVELVTTPDTGAEHHERGRRLAEAMGKVVVSVPDGPGFLVNRCARPYYLEALCMLERGDATPAQIDAACVAVGFPMGPCKLMDAIGLDVSLAVTRAMHEQSGGEPRWRPSPIQEDMVETGRLGVKSGSGFYDYSTDDSEEPFAVDAQQVAAITEPIIAQLVNEASYAVEAGVGTEADIDMSMTLALRYPRGPFAWGRELGYERVVSCLDSLAATNSDPRYTVAETLREAAVTRAQGESSYA